MRTVEQSADVQCEFRGSQHASKLSMSTSPEYSKLYQTLAVKSLDRNRIPVPGVNVSVLQAGSQSRIENPLAGKLRARARRPNI